MPVTPSLAIHFTLSETGVSESVLLVHFNSHLFCILIVKKLKDFIPQKYAKNNVSNNKKKTIGWPKHRRNSPKWKQKWKIYVDIAQ